MGEVCGTCEYVHNTAKCLHKVIFNCVRLLYCSGLNAERSCLNVHNDRWICISLMDAGSGFLCCALSAVLWQILLACPILNLFTSLSCACHGRVICYSFTRVLGSCNYTQAAFICQGMIVCLSLLPR